MKKITSTSKEPVRINILLRDHNIGSRRSVDQLIENKQVTINGKHASLGSKVCEGDVIKVSIQDTNPTYALYHKPRGEITGRIAELPGCEPVGRLDKESEGLIFYTNDFRVVDALLNPKHKREKEYEVAVREKTTPRVVTLLKKGIQTREAKYAPVISVSIYNEGRSIRIVLTEGKKHEIRRMLNALNLTITSLKRVRIMSFVLKGLKQKEVHVLTPGQVDTLLKELALNE